jgi:hypothetical protein
VEGQLTAKVGASQVLAVTAADEVFEQKAEVRLQPRIGHVTCSMPRREERCNSLF